MDERTTIGVVSAAVVLVLRELVGLAISLLTTTRANRVADRKDAMDEVYRLYEDVRSERNDLRDKLTTYMVENERKNGLIQLLREQLRDAGVTEDPSTAHK